MKHYFAVDNIFYVFSLSPSARVFRTREVFIIEKYNMPERERERVRDRQMDGWTYKKSDSSLQLIVINIKRGNRWNKCRKGRKPTT